MTSPLPAVPPRVSRFHRGYSVAAVDSLVLRVNAVLGGDPAAEPITADQLRSITFPAERGGYDETAVDAVIDQLIALLPPAPSAAPGTGSPGPGAPGAADQDTLLSHVPAELRDPRFTPTQVRKGYATAEVDALIDRVIAGCALTNARDRAAVARILENLRASTLHTAHPGYDMQEVDAWWQRVDDLLAEAAR